MRMIEVALPSGQTILVSSSATGGAQDVSRKGVLALEPALHSLREFADLLLQTVNAGQTPAETEVEFSVSLDISTGKLLAAIVEGGAQAAVHVRLLWRADGAE